MRANTDIMRRLSFDAFADLYDVARPRFGAELTSQLIAFAGIAADAHVLEVGAGTGQWIDGLLANGVRIEALEPGDAMRALLVDKYGARGVVAHAGDFEHFEVDTRFDAIVSSNAFHWVDPAVGYDRAADHLAPDGCVLFMWNFLVADDATDLNDALRELLPTTHTSLTRILGVPDELDAWLEEGRDELRASGRFEPPRFVFLEEPFTLEPRQLIDLLASYATDQPLRVSQREKIAAELATQLAPAPVASMRNRIYAVTARVQA